MFWIVTSMLDKTCNFEMSTEHVTVKFYVYFYRQNI